MTKSSKKGTGGRAFGFAPTNSRPGNKKTQPLHGAGKSQTPTPTKGKQVDGSKAKTDGHQMAQDPTPQDAQQPPAKPEQTRYRGALDPERNVMGPIAGAKNMGKTVYRPVCFYKESDHKGEVFCFYSSNDNDLSCIERKPDLTVGTENPTDVDVMMFESFTRKWGPVACYPGTNEIFAFMGDPDDTIRGLLSGCHLVKGKLAWDVVENLGSGIVALGRVVFFSKWCPGSLQPGETNPAATQRYADGSIISPHQQPVGGMRYPH
ncbi:hypothetical protein BJ508DRAFT_308072 [Ascobolus immersus RN42]|uniref:Uncharacterized protein n=1 Tax=Ascobolus immersus RN42 TaxID=1160509 RepID=A0A3N4I105_ASCIM|nr:hypothetical protein BJ508DRAFT_308072 [Ascobolus immersus RN42]